MKVIIPLLIGCLVIISCNNSSKVNKSEETDSTVAVKDSSVLMDSITEMDTASAVMPRESIIQVPIAAETLPITKLQRTITSDMQSVHVLLNDLDVGLLRVSISHSLPDANIRISQIVLPDGSTDGPFGQQMSFDVKQKGNYTIIINKSNMASGTQVGDVFITIER
ncbi:hypothetical protein [Niabella ginsengisoli]|uniref:Uncharacterized protein n=1 Tax=Niabella ginsengisoli TaxID=522298 RepID=A0ABS9SEX8_9BACT|nr:hypothetical protein [Niabella ginsengisoli]MCH5596922.1 hypothetical protein [Niabella ginsengisoli]